MNGRGAALNSLPKMALALIGWTALATALRLYGISDRSLWYDEGYTWLLTSGDGLAATFQALERHVGSERMQPLYFLLLVPWRALAGDSEFALRLFSVLCGGLTVAILVRAAYRVFGFRAALGAALTSTVSAFAIQYAQEARPYAFLMLLYSGFLSAVLFDHVEYWAHRRRRVMQCALWAAALAGGSILAAAPLVGTALADRVLKRSWREWFCFWVVPGIMAAVVAAVSYSGALDAAPQSGDAVPKAQNFFLNLLFVAYGLLVGQNYGPTVEELRGGYIVATLIEHSFRLALLAAVVLLLLVAVAASLFWHGNKAAQGCFLILTFIYSLAAGAITAWLSGFNWLPRHAFYLAPPLWLLASAVLSAPRKRIGLISVGLLALLNLAAYWNQIFLPEYQLDDYRTTASILNDDRHESSQALLLWGNLELLRDYYEAGHLLDGRRIKPEELPATLSAMAGPTRREIVLVLNRPFYWYGGSDVEKAIAPCCDVVQRTKLPYFEVLVVRPTNSNP